MAQASVSKYEHYMLSVVATVGAAVIFMIGIVIIEMLFVTGIRYFSVLRQHAKVNKAYARVLNVKARPDAMVQISTIVPEFFDSYYSHNHSIAIGPDGLPVFVYTDTHTLVESSTLKEEYRNGIKVAKCADASCTSATIQTIDTSLFPMGQTGSAIAVGKDNLPVIVYTANSGGGDMNLDDIIKIVRCKDASCMNKEVSILEQSKDGQVYYSPLVSMDSTGVAVISYMEIVSAVPSLIVLRCNDLFCENSKRHTMVSSPLLEVFYDLELDSKDAPTAVYKTALPWELHVAKCIDIDCNEVKSNRIASNVDTHSFSMSMALAPSGAPYIVYVSSFNNDTLVATFDMLACSDSICSSVRKTTVDTGVYSGAVNSIAIGKNGNPVMSFYSRENGGGSIGLYFARCLDSKCQSFDKVKVEGGDYNTHPSMYNVIGIAKDGMPIIGTKYVDYLQGGSNQFQAIKCLTQSCH
jgi:hypothetical protein